MCVVSRTALKILISLLPLSVSLSSMLINITREQSHGKREQ